MAPSSLPTGGADERRFYVRVIVRFWLVVMVILGAVAVIGSAIGGSLVIGLIVAAPTWALGVWGYSAGTYVETDGLRLRGWLFSDTLVPWASIERIEVGEASTGVSDYRAAFVCRMDHRKTQLPALSWTALTPDEPDASVARLQRVVERHRAAGP
jgi:PH (Pleckstrin Homology) domain-containing protein